MYYHFNSYEGFIFKNKVNEKHRLKNIFMQKQMRRVYYQELCTKDSSKDLLRKEEHSLQRKSQKQEEMVSLETGKCGETGIEAV